MIFVGITTVATVAKPHSLRKSGKIEKDNKNIHNHDWDISGAIHTYLTWFWDYSKYGRTTVKWYQL